MKKFEMVHLFFPPSICEKEVFTEETAPSWLTGSGKPKGSTMDNSWFWEGHVLTLRVGQSIKTDFRKITRVE